MSVLKFDMNGFIAKQDWGGSKFIPPCIFYAFPPDNVAAEGNGSASSAGTKKVKNQVDLLCQMKFISNSFSECIAFIHF